MSTDDFGHFAFEELNSASYRVSVSYLGYQTTIRTTVLTQDETLAIVLEPTDQTLDEVVISVNKPTLKKEVDRLVFNVAETALSEGNMLELLRSTPGVLVMNNSIQVKNTTPVVYINDRKVHLTNDELAQLLASSSANSIKSVEVITNPPAKYDASSGAVINIIMDKNLITGYSGNIFTNYTQGEFPRYNAGITNFYKTDKINLFANYSYTHNKINRETEEDINFLEDDAVEEVWHTDTNRNTRSQTHNFNMNLDFMLNEQNTLSLSSNILYLPYFNYLTLGRTTINDATGNYLYNFDSDNLSRDKKHNIGFDVDYVLRSDRSRFSINGHYTNYDYHRNQNVNSQYFGLTETAFSTAFMTEADQVTDIVTAQIDYAYDFNEDTALSLGVKSSFIETQSYINQFDIIDGNTIYNTDLSDAFDYDESILAAYVSFEKQWEKWSLSAGIRAEQTDLTGTSPITNQTNEQDYFKWFPTLNISHNISDRTSLYLNYNRSIERPIYQDLNPFNYFLNDNTIVSGNPNLQPAFRDHVVLGTSLLDMISIEAYYSYKDGSFLELPIQNNEDKQFVYTPTNLDSTTEYGFDFSTYFNLSDRWFVYFVSSFYNVEDEAIINNEKLIKDTWSNYSVLSNDLSFLKDNSLTANLTFIFIGRNQQGFQEVESRFASDLSIKKSIFQGKGTLSLAAADLFNAQDFSVTSRYLNQDNYRFYNQDNRYIKLGFSYKFGNTSLKTNERQKERQETDRLEKD